MAASMARVEVQGHRGLGNLEPHNTLRAFQAAAAHPAVRSVEFDVRRIADGQLVVSHGPEVDKVDRASGVRATEEMLLEELQALDLGLGQRVPLFADVVDVCLGGGLRMNVEIKTKEHETVDEVLQILRSRGASPDDFHVSSFHRQALERVMAVWPEVPLGALYNGAARLVDEADASKGSEWHATPADFAEWFADRRVPGDSVNLRSESVTAEEVAEARRHGKQVLVWYSCICRPEFAEGAADYRRVMDLGVDVMCVNHPNTLAEVVGVFSSL